MLLAFPRGDFVDRLGWITDEQLIDAVSSGEVTPGPVGTIASDERIGVSSSFVRC